MSVTLQKILYTAEATVEGGREGDGRTSDGRLDVQLSVPETMGGQVARGSTPNSSSPWDTEHASGRVARRCARPSPRRSGSRIVCGGRDRAHWRGWLHTPSLARLHAPHVCHDDAPELMARAHERCPYSTATRGNIDVLLMVAASASRTTNRLGLADHRRRTIGRSRAARVLPRPFPETGPLLRRRGEERCQGQL
jgi:hypothetical protein